MGKGKRLLVLMLFLSVFTTFIFLAVRTSRAEEKIKLKEVVVTATRVEESIEDIAQDVTVITKKDIETGASQTVTEAIRNIAGINIFEYGNRGATSTIRLRGSSAGQVLILIDGKRINKPGDGQVDLNTLNIPLENIERIEILKGAASALYGADAIGGVVNIITKIPDKPITKISSSYGRFVTKKTDFSTSQKFGDTGFYISMFKDRSDGFRPNSRYDIDGFDAKVSHEFSKDTRLDLNLDYNFKDSQQPGSITWPTPGAFQKDENIMAGASLKMKNTIVKLYRHTSKIRYVNPGSEDNTHKNYVDAVDIQHVFSVGNSNLITAGVELMEEKLYSVSNMTPSNSVGNHSRTRRGLFVQDEILILDKHALTLGGRFDSIGQYDKLSPKSSLLIKLPEKINLSLSVNKGFRVPTMNSLFWPDTGWAAGNPSLVPEESIEYDAGIQKFFSDTGSIKLFAFFNKAKNLIQWAPDSSGKWTPMNIARTEKRGISAEGKLSIVKAADIGIGYTFIDPEDLTTRKKIRFSTRHQFKGSASVYPDKGMILSIDGRYVKNYVVQDGDPKSYFVLDGKASRKIKLYNSLHGEIFLTAKNILDRKYETVQNYPMLPRQLMAGLGFEF